MYSEITLCNAFYFRYSKNVFFNHCKILFVTNKVLLTYLLVKISHFKFLVMREKNIFVYKLFLPLDISDFSLFLCKNCNPP